MDRFWVNPYDNEMAARYKPYQIEVASRVGFDILPTLVTNNPEEAIVFVEQCGGSAVYKTFVSHVRQQANGVVRGVYARRVGRAFVSCHAEAIRHAPCLFQEYVAKKSELRVTVIGDRVFTSRCHTTAVRSSRTRISVTR